VSGGLRRQLRRVAARVRCQRGQTLIELLIYAVTSVVVLSAVIAFLLATFNQQDEISSRTVATDQAEQGLEQLVSDLRQAMTSVSILNPSGTTTEIQFDIPTPGSPTTGELVSWTCPSTGASTSAVSGACTRVLTESGGTTLTRTEITGVESMLFAPISSNGGSLSLPVTSSNTVASVGMTLTVQITDDERDTNNGSNPTYNPARILPGSSGEPIVLQASADLRNFA
jgi:hypothetical protein